MKATHYIHGTRLEAGSRSLNPLTSPVDGAPLGSVTVADAAVVDQAVQSAQKAFQSWSLVPVKDRVQVLYKFKTLVEQNIGDLAKQVTAENGKTTAESAAGIARGIEIVEYAASLPQLFAGEILEVSTGVDCYTRRFPLGVVAGITPFNFPAMVPMWMFPMAIACGNSFILKPSEQVPFTPLLLADLLKQAGLPDGVFNIVQGDRETVETVLDHRGIAAAAFVGSTAVAKAVYDRGIASNKRMLTLGGAKNHLIVVPDADPVITAKNVVSSAVGCAGQRCMAASVLIAVGDCDHIIDAIEQEMRSLACGKEVGAIISAKAKERIEGYITRAAERGAKVILDGRGQQRAGHYVAPTLIDGITREDECANDEIFGPVLSILRVKTLNEAIAIENANPYGNAACIYTTSGATARYFEMRAESGMVGVNIGVPVPRDPFGFGGWNASKFGPGDITGKDAIGFWTKTKKVTAKWTAKSTNWMS
ncbi:MAG: CoA-acylating methylmalonate-semialdehyde dehydrogenase [Pedosphaera sp.]|nr:CoA-acylating methylmalonate-semialdehyde dehydrogenase [Pedosphaera sp.]